MRQGTEGDDGASGAPGREGPPDYEIPEERLPPGFVETVTKMPDVVAVPFPAATVVLMRESAAGPEVLLLRRNRATGFVPGAYVFPGGRVDRADGDEALVRCWDGLTREGAERRLGLGPDADPPAIAYYGAAVREAVEETGLLPAVVGGVRDEGGGELSGRAVGEAREALLGQGVPFARVLGGLGARLDGAAVEYIAHWVTPAVEPRRYDTRFFAARVPRGSAAVYDEREMTDAAWLTPGAALDRHRDGRLPMIFPTIRTLEDLCDFATVDELLAYYRSRAIARVQPEIVRTATGVALRVS
ncbi:MAG: NUDIX hydrolase [Gemmatimonadetes bacterium]|nr:NUDIX hydrolase [Gemmatimonadota bacterium]